MSTRTPALLALAGFGLWLAGMPRSLTMQGFGTLAATDFTVTTIGPTAAIGLAFAASAYVTIGLQQGRKLASAAGAFLFAAALFHGFALVAVQPLAVNAAILAMAIAAASLAIEGAGRARIVLIGSAIASVLMAVALGGLDTPPMPILLDISGTTAGLLWLITGARELGGVKLDSNAQVRTEIS